MGAKARTRAFLDAPTAEERVRRMPCIVCRKMLGHRYGPSEAHHWPTRGAGNHIQVLPLCGVHHRMFHTLGQRSWQARYGINLADEAARIAALLEET